MVKFVTKRKDKSIVTKVITLTKVVTALPKLLVFLIQHSVKITQNVISSLVYVNVLMAMKEEIAQNLNYVLQMMIVEVLLKANVILLQVFVLVFHLTLVKNVNSPNYLLAMDLV